QQRVAVGVEVAAPEQRHADREQHPRGTPDRAALAAVQAQREEDREHGREPQQVDDRPAALERRHAHVQRGDQRAGGAGDSPGRERSARGHPGLSSPRAASSLIAAMSALPSSSVFAAVSCTRNPTSSFGTSGYAASVTYTPFSNRKSPTKSM